MLVRWRSFNQKATANRFKVYIQNLIKAGQFREIYSKPRYLCEACKPNNEMAFLIILHICSYFILSGWQKTKHFAHFTVGLILLRYSNFFPTLNSRLCIRNVFGSYRKFIIMSSESLELTKYDESGIIEKNNIIRFQNSPLCGHFWFEVLV